MGFELTGVLLALFPGLANAWLATNNTKNSKVERKPEETQAIVRIWWKSNLTVINCQGLRMKTDGVTYLYYTDNKMFASSNSVENVFSCFMEQLMPNLLYTIWQLMIISVSGSRFIKVQVLKKDFGMQKYFS